MRGWTIAAGCLLAGAALSPASAAPLRAAPADNVTVPGAVAWSMTSADGKRRYRLAMAVPVGPAPADGWPVIYVLDGNAFFATMVEAVRLESFLAGYQPAIVVGVGYATDAPIDVVARNFDYTPPTGPAPEYDDRNPQRPAGGAEHFLAFLETAVKPAVAARAPVDRRRQALFGHSYGGLLASYAYVRHPGAFDHVIAASASLWYRKFFLPAMVKAGAPPGGYRGRLLLLAGENEQVPGADDIAMFGPDRVRVLGALRQVDSARDLAAAIRAGGGDARFHLFEGETHASVVPAAISRAVRFFLLPRRTAPASIEEKRR